MAAKNRRVLLASRPTGEPVVENFQLVEEHVQEPAAGRMLLRSIYLSLDPYMRGRMNAGPSYAAPVETGEVMDGRAVCEVVMSRLAGYAEGDIVFAAIGWQEYSYDPTQE
jgi:NADPH-dependent curcumin reductase CurA